MADRGEARSQGGVAQRKAAVRAQVKAKKAELAELQAGARACGGGEQG